MKSLTEFIADATKQFVYRIKIAGELDTALYDKFKAGLEKFNLDTCTKPKKTPIQKDPLGFPALSNQEINIFDVTLNYPASIDEIRDVARLADIDVNMIVVLDKQFNDSMTDEFNNVEDTVRLDTPEYPKNREEHTKAKDEYADSFQDAARQFAGDAKTEFEIAGEKTPPAKFNTDTDQGTKGPLFKIDRKSIKDLLK